MASIFELTESQRKLMNAVESGDISEDDAEDTFEGMEAELNDKITDYCTVLRVKTMQLENISSEIDRLSKLKSEASNEIARIKKSLMFGLGTVEKTKFDTGMFKGHIKAGSKSVNVIDVDAVPPEYVETVVTSKVRKLDVKKALLAGYTVDGCEIVTGEKSLIIK